MTNSRQVADIRVSFFNRFVQQTDQIVVLFMGGRDDIGSLPKASLIDFRLLSSRVLVLEPFLEVIVVRLTVVHDGTSLPRAVVCSAP